MQVITFEKMTTITKKIDTLDTLDNIIHFGLDHLEIFWTFKCEDKLFDKLDFDNSNYWELEDYSFTKNEVPKYKYKIIFTKNNYSLFAYYKWDSESNSIIKSKDKIVIYSTAFKLLTYDEIYYFLDWYFTLKKCFRFDVCVDINIDINILLWEFTDLKTWKEYKKMWKIETRYIWDSNKYKNKRQVIRIYNKILDITEKHKHKLYKNYLVEDFVTRIELEVRSELARNIEPLDVFNNNILSWIFKNYLRKHTDLFNFNEIENISLYKKPEKSINQEEYHSTLYKQKRRQIFVWHAKSIYELWYCPVRVLIWEGLLLNDTKKFLDNDVVEILANIETEIKRDNFHRWEEIQKIKASNYKRKC